jgi:hypothetical protein
MADEDGQLSAAGGRLALVAHDDKKAEMAEFAATHEAALALSMGSAPKPPEALDTFPLWGEPLVGGRPV